MNNIKIGDRFGILTISGNYNKRYKSWECVCDCGNKRRFGKISLKTRHNTSCGCMAHKANLTHGMSGTLFYRKWDSINKRCTNKSYHQYYRYGGRGIKSSWLGNFNKFKEEMLDSYNEHYKKFGSDTEIDRIDFDGNYCKENCRWVTKSQQANNRSTNKFIIYHGEKMTISQLAKKLGLYRIKLHNALRVRTEKELLEIIENGSIYKTSKGKKLDLI